MTLSSRWKCARPAGWAPGPPSSHASSGALQILIAVIMGAVNIQQPLAAATGKPDPDLEHRVQALSSSLDDYVANGMKAFGIPGVAVGIVVGDKLVYSKGYGVRQRGGPPVDAKTLFQVGSTTKAFLATTIAIAVDRKKLHWDDQVVDLDSEFQLKDPWVTREFRIFDLLAQRSGLPPYVNDMVGILGFDESALIRSLRYVEPVSSFRSRFAYTNVTHIIAGRIVANVEGEADWNAVLRKELLDPLGMKDTSYTAEAIKAAPNHAMGHRYAPDGSVEVPFTQVFPYNFGGAGDINSNIEDMAHWVRLQLGNGSFEGRDIVSPENLAVTRTPKVGINDKMAYALGWVITQTPNGSVVWHDGGTNGFGAYVGVQVDKHIGVILLTNESNAGFADATGPWIFDRLLGNPEVDHMPEAVTSAKKRFADNSKIFAKPTNPRPSSPIALRAGIFANPVFGKASLKHESDALVLAFKSGAELSLEPWNGDIFTARLVPNGHFAAVVEDQGPQPNGFVQFQMDKDGRLNLLRLSFDDGQAYEFRRE